MVAVLGVTRRAALQAAALVLCTVPADAFAARQRNVRAPDGVRIAYDVRGSGATTLVLVHGWSCDRSYWDGQADALAARFRVVTVDLAGHGASGRNRQEWTIASFGGDVAAVVRAAGARRVVLVGHSMGGDAVLEAALRLPGRVDGIVWVDAYKQIGDFRTPAQIDTMVASFRRDFVATTRAFARLMFPLGADRALVERVAADMAAAPPAVALPSMAAAIGYDRKVPEVLAKLALPIVAINPDKPASDPVSLARYGVTLEQLTGVGHFPMLEAPGRFNALLTTVVERLPRQDAPLEMAR